MNKKIIYVVMGVIVLVGVFYAGMTYGGNNVRAAITSRGLGLGQNGGTFSGRGARSGGGFTTGQIISKDATSITVSLTGGGSKIILLDSSTPINKQAAGTLTDLTVGTEVSVTGTTNGDGSVTAQSVQIRPKMPTTAPISNVGQ